MPSLPWLPEFGPVCSMSAHSDAAASFRLGGATPSTSAPTAYQITLTHHQESVKVPLYRIFPVESAIHWVSVAPGGNLERDMTTGGARAVSHSAAGDVRSSQKSETLWPGGSGVLARLQLQPYGWCHL